MHTSPVGLSPLSESLTIPANVPVELPLPAPVNNTKVAPLGFVAVRNGVLGNRPVFAINVVDCCQLIGDA